MDNTAPGFTACRPLDDTAPIRNPDVRHKNGNGDEGNNSNCNHSFQNGEAGVGAGGGLAFGVSGVQKEEHDSGGAVARGSIAERRAAKCGFNADRISTARFRATSPFPSPVAWSPCLTIPSGISPTALLDSPILLPNSQSSPTTGTFVFPLSNHESSVLNAVDPADADRCRNICSSLRFKLQGDLDSLSVFSSLENQVSCPFDLVEKDGADYQAHVSGEQLMNFEFPAEFSKGVTSTSFDMDSVINVKVLDDMIVTGSSGNLPMCHSGMARGESSLLKCPVSGEDGERHQHSEGDLKRTNPPVGTLRNSEDGYNWRKYGQKQVKGSEYPRSYYKCTHPNCQVKKKVERSHDGQITEIIYKGAHNHPKPQLSRRASFGSTFSIDESEMAEGSVTNVKIEGGSVCGNILTGSDWRADGLERTSSVSVLTELSDPLSTTQGRSVGVLESAETPELSSTLASHDDDDGATQGSISVDDSADDDESESKRRKTESCFNETNLGSRAVREPRVIVQIESEVDILDDGYRWRKYGQKVVKGNPNPRSYYKCTSAGCLVRKHVERASHNLKCVITTYEGKHDHEVPIARNASHTNSIAGNLSRSAANTQSTLAFPRSSLVPKPETQIQDIPPPFNGKPDFNNKYLKPSFLGNLSNDMSCGAFPMYKMNPTMQNTMPYGSYGLNLNRIAAHQVGLIPSMVPDFPISLPLNLPLPANLALAGFDFNSSEKPMGQVPSSDTGQQSKENDVRFIRPKQEQKDGSPYDACFTIVDHANASSSSSSLSVYQQVVGHFSS